MALGETAELAIRINLEGNAQAGIGRLNKQLGGLQRSVGRVGRGVGQVGAGLARAGLLVGGAAVTGLTAAAKAAIDFEDAFAGVRKTVDEADLRAAGMSFESLAKDLRTMATEIPIAATEFARIGEIAGALGVKAQDIQEFTETVALMGVTTNLTSDQAADDFGRLGTILGLTGDDFEELADSIVALGNAGASTESEITDITRRFAATAKQAGLTKEEMVGLASVTASLGFEPERGGTALARVFANMATNIATANAKGKAISRAIGRPVRDLQRDIDRGKGLPIFLDILEEIRDMRPTEAARFLKSIGVTNVSDRTVFLAMSQQLPEVNRQLGIAKNATGALSEEARKRFDTIASKVQLFKNNLTEAGISIGEGMLPAIGRATDKLIAFLKLPSTQGDLKRLGEDIGSAIDGIDWDDVLRQGREFVGVLKGALGVAKAMFDAFNALPGPIKEATAGFLILNKLSGGLIGAGVGNIAGGIGESVVRGLGSKLPKVGALFAQPVFVTNWPPGFGLGGGVPAATGGAGIPAAAAIGVGGIVGAVKQGSAQGFSDALRSSGIPNTLGRSEGQLTIMGNSLGTLGEAVRLLREGFNRKVPESTTAINRMKQSTDEKVIGTTNAIERMKASQDSNDQHTQVAVRAGALGVQNTTRAAALTNAMIVANQQRASTAAIVGAIERNRAVVNVTQVTKSTTIQNRYGPGNGSAGQDRMGWQGD